MKLAKCRKCGADAARRAVASVVNAIICVAVYTIHAPSIIADAAYNSVIFAAVPRAKRKWQINRFRKVIKENQL